MADRVLSKRMNLVPGEIWGLPSMVHTRVSGQKGVLYLEFETAGSNHGPECHHQPLKSTILVPITPLDAAGLLRSLRNAQQQGLIPHVVEPNSPTKPN
jgi:hypothetical protein